MRIVVQDTVFVSEVRVCFSVVTVYTLVNFVAEKNWHHRNSEVI